MRSRPTCGSAGVLNIMRARLGLSTALSCVVACGSGTHPSSGDDPLTAACGRSVSRIGNLIEVVPSGSDDTRGLQCAIDAAIAAGIPMSIRLAAGTFHTRQLVAKSFLGRIAGSGMEQTTLATTGRPMPVTPRDFTSKGEPGPDNPWPSLIAFVDGDFSVSDLTIRVADEAPTTGWSLSGLPATRSLAHALVVTGRSARAAFERVTVVGKSTPSDPIAGHNVHGALVFAGLLPGSVPLTGTFEVRGCSFVEVAAGVGASNLRSAAVTWMANASERTIIPAHLAELDATAVAVAGNRFQDGTAGIQVVDGLSDTQLVLAGNQLDGRDGIEITASFGDGVSCFAIGNDIQTDAANGGVSVWLGPATRGCLVISRAPVRDEGTANRVIALP